MKIFKKFYITLLDLVSTLTRYDRCLEIVLLSCIDDKIFLLLIIQSISIHL